MLPSSWLGFSLLAASFQVPAALGAVHRMYVGNLYPPSAVYSVQFDDQSHELSLVKNISAFSGHAWIAFNHDKSYLYGVSLQNSLVASYSVINGTDLKLEGTLPFDGSCKDKKSAFVTASTLPPYRVYTAAWPGPESCGSALSVVDQASSGLVNASTQSWRYLTVSGIHGLALGRQKEGKRNELIYSADLNGDSVWTHEVEGQGGMVKETGRLQTAPSSHPRHLVANPNGNYLYVVMESANRVTQYVLDKGTGAPIAEEASFYLLPNDITNATNQYWSAEVMLSHDSRYLWATARAYINTTNHGYVNGFLLDGQGKIVKHMFKVPTTTVGGYANAISPAPAGLGSEWAAMTDVPRGYVQMWRMTGRTQTDLGVEYTSAEAVSLIDIPDGGCCANIIWYD